MRTKNAFTLIELLVVIAIIALLLSILAPSLNKVKQLAGSVICGSNLKQLGISTIMYNMSNDGYFPYALECINLPYDHPNYTPNSSDPPRSAADWACRWHDEPYNNTNHPELAGALWPYLENQEVTMCPAFRRLSKARGKTHPNHNPNIDIEPQYAYSMNAWLGPLSSNDTYENLGAVTYEAQKIQDVKNPANVFVFSEENMWTIRQSPQPWDPYPHKYNWSGSTLNDNGLFSHWFGIAGWVDCFATFHKTSWNTVNKRDDGVANAVMADGHVEVVQNWDPSNPSTKDQPINCVKLSDPTGSRWRTMRYN